MKKGSDFKESLTPVILNLHTCRDSVVLNKKKRASI